MGMLPHPDPEGFRQGGGLPQPKPQWGFGYAAEGAKALPNHFARKPLSETVSYLQHFPFSQHANKQPCDSMKPQDCLFFCFAFLYSCSAVQLSHLSHRALI